MSVAAVDRSSGGASPPTPGSGDGDPGIGKLAAQVARRLESEIVRRGWPVGDSLGSEPELRERYGVSRSVLREAVRLVEHHQVARMRRGPSGGLFVTAPDAGPAARALVIYLEYVGTSIDDLMQARRPLEPLAAGLAAQRVTEEGIERLRRTVQAEAEAEAEAAVEPGDRSIEALHVVLGELSANSVLRLFVDVLTRLTSRYGEPSPQTPRQAYRRARAEGRRRQAEIADAVIAGDARRAEALLAGYLDGVAAWMQRHGVGRGASSAIEDASRTKLAEVVARRLHQDIAADGWPVGAVVGSEADLLARYGISRAVLREAVRLLEYHSAARMRRGPGGGLIVRAPDPQASIDTMALYLEYMRASGADLLAVRDAIELGVVSRVAARHGDAAVAERLGAAARLLREGPVYEQDKADHFHRELAVLAGNPVLVLFLRILTELWTRHSAGRQEEVGAAARAEVEYVHRRIAETVLAGDDGLARHRMRRHLAALGDWWH